MAGRNDVRVLVVDDNPDVGRLLAPILRKHHCIAEIATGSGPTLEQSALRVAHRFCPHVAIVDLRLYSDDQDDQSGLRLLRKLRPAHCIVYSNYLSAQATREIQRTPGVRWVGKREGPKALMQILGKLARDICAARRPLEVRSAGWDVAHDAQALFGRRVVPPGIIDDVLRQVFAQEKTICLKAIGGLDQPFATVSRGHSLVFRAQADGLEPVVVKIARTEKIRREQGQYNRYVEGRLGGHCHAQLQRSVEFWELGAAVYSFMGSEQTALLSFSAAYRGGRSSTDLLAALTHFFGEVWQRHYTARPVLLAGNLFDAYDAALHLKRHLDRQHRTIDAGVTGCPEALCLDPMAWVLEHQQLSAIAGARQAVTHGDLHGDNLFVDGGRAWAIDFGRTGPGHALRDFVELEVDLLTRLAALPADATLYCALITEVLQFGAPPSQLPPSLQAVDEAGKATEVIRGLRELAKQALGEKDLNAEEYLWSLLLDAVFVASLAPRHSLQASRALLLSGMLCRRLEEGGCG